MTQQYIKGALIDRNIDGMLFRGIIESVSSSTGTVCIRYIDDDNVEDRVPMDDIQMANPSEKHSSNNKNSNSNRSSHDDALLRPLAGLIEDDSAIRALHQPKVTLHGNDGDTSKEPVIIINGAESRLAVGAGLRALRYLKPV